PRRSALRKKTGTRPARAQESGARMARVIACSSFPCGLPGATPMPAWRRRKWKENGRPARERVHSALHALHDRDGTICKSGHPTVSTRPSGRMLRKASIPALRRQIDRIDDQLLRLLNRRARFALAIAEQKARNNSVVYAPGREKGVLSRLVRVNRGPLPEPLVRAIFREIISASRS